MAVGRWISGRALGRVLPLSLIVASLLAWPQPVDAHQITIEPIAPEVIHTVYPDWKPVRITDQDQVLLKPARSVAPDMVWSPSTGAIFIGSINDALPTGYAVESQMNASGTVVSLMSGDPEVPFVFDFATQTRTPLPTGGYAGFHIARIADDGTIIGTVNSVSGGDVFTGHAAVWSGSPYQLHVLPDVGGGGVGSWVNEHGVAVGEVWASDHSHIIPASWDLSTFTMTDLTPWVGTPIIDAGPSVDDHGRILVQLGSTIGTGTGPAGNDVILDPATGVVTRPFDPDMGVSAALSPHGELLYEQLDAPSNYNGPVTLTVLDLNSGERRQLPSMTVESTPSLNDRGQVVFASSTDAVSHGYVWDPIAGLVDLGTDGDHGLVPTTLNETGRIGGYHHDDANPWLATLRLNPQPPEELSANTSVTAGAATSLLHWDPPSSPGDAPVDTYDVYRNGALVATVPASADAFTDDVSSLPGGSSATYQVAATNVYGESNLSQPVTVVLAATESAPAAPVAATPVAATPQFTG